MPTLRFFLSSTSHGGGTTKTRSFLPVLRGCRLISKSADEVALVCACADDVDRCRHPRTDWLASLGHEPRESRADSATNRSGLSRCRSIDARCNVLLDSDCLPKTNETIDTLKVGLSRSPIKIRWWLNVAKRIWAS